MSRWYRYWVAYTTILVKEVLRFSRIWVQTILPAAISTARASCRRSSTPSKTVAMARQVSSSAR